MCPAFQVAAVSAADLSLPSFGDASLRRARPIGRVVLPQCTLQAATLVAFGLASPVASLVGDYPSPFPGLPQSLCCAPGGVRAFIGCWPLSMGTPFLNFIYL